MSLEDGPIFLHQFLEEHESRKRRRLAPARLPVVGPGLLLDAEWSRVDTSHLKHAEELQAILDGDGLISLVALDHAEVLVHGVTRGPSTRTRAARRQSREYNQGLRTFRIFLRVSETPPDPSSGEGPPPYAVYKWEALAPTAESPKPPKFRSHPSVVRVPGRSEVVFVGAVEAPHSEGGQPFEVWMDAVHGKREHLWSLVAVDGKAPSPRSHHAAVALAPEEDAGTVRVAIFGGTSPTSELVEDFMWVLELKRRKEGLKGKWRRVQLESGDGSLPNPACRVAVCAVGCNDVYLHGGLGQHNRPLNDLWRITLSSSLRRGWCSRVDIGSVVRSIPRASHSIYHVKRHSMVGSAASSDCLLVLGGTEPQCVEWFSIHGSRWYRSTDCPEIIPPRSSVVPTDRSTRMPTTDGRFTILHRSSSLPYLSTFRTRPPLSQPELEASLDRLARFKSIAHLLHCFDDERSPPAHEVPPNSDSEIAVSPESAFRQLETLGDCMGGQKFLFKDSSDDVVLLSLEGKLRSLEEVSALQAAVHELAGSVTSQGVIVAVVMTKEELIFGFSSDRLKLEVDAPVWATASSIGDREELVAVLRLIRQHAPRLLETSAFKALVSGHMAGVERPVSAVIIADALPWLISAVTEASSDSESVRELSENFEVRNPFPLARA
ncbi:hypothetical protein FOZ60_002953 [Perkinsus olseni]|uniref:Uncharacterized protein n=1 Tax=Perkinsus olseni TaxID=32597 RepID=A0A7J6NWK6_PEROL|nr:hypothetical protein FOZ60_002953 [Perkinsus olseni]